MPKLHKFVNDYFERGHVKYRAGHHYEPNEETTLAVKAGHAEEVEATKGVAPVKPFVDPRTIESRKSALRAQIASAEAELKELEKSSPAPEPAKTEKK
jgi:hypothetical protein